MLLYILLRCLVKGVPKMIFALFDSISLISCAGEI
nr:MAG TPA: hypothetical protein [Caudoviricetes sp.]